MNETTKEVLAIVTYLVVVGLVLWLILDMLANDHLDNRVEIHTGPDVYYLEVERRGYTVKSQSGDVDEKFRSINEVLNKIENLTIEDVK